MANFAEIDENNIVKRVIVVSNNVCFDNSGNEVEAIGAAWCANLLGGRWVQTSYNGRIRYHFAGIGYTYDEVNDAFIEPQPFESWSLDDKFVWRPPVPRPDDGLFYEWNEGTRSWNLLSL